MSLGEPKIKVGDTMPMDVIVTGFAATAGRAEAALGLPQGQEMLSLPPGAFTPPDPCQVPCLKAEVRAAHSTAAVSASLRLLLRRLLRRRLRLLRLLSARSHAFDSPIRPLTAA